MVNIKVEIKYETNKKYKSSFAQFYRDVEVDQLEELKKETIKRFNNWKKTNVEYVKEELICEVYDK